ncbi:MULTISPECIES: APC family permease [unclassified Haladaptatus]|uniref:APC family permease n=1 Tax=unclassified Haladaptatus TaxID=2622732 RepID=UPI00209BE1A7|nr:MULTISPECIES: APC family permease [unclassified Haladaptatus]MCO8245839.1 APC family permease [Haladaptatus sp. AB643]MCO8256186.1 APC family permease [Haladaptatus sp. AB618]
MVTERLGLTEAVSFALGGIIGGGIFAVLGVVARVAGPTAWVAYLIAGIVVMATGYSYVKLNERVPTTEESGGAVAFIEVFLDRPTLAGMVGWTLIVGYVGTMAMYAYAFGAYFGAIFGITELPFLGLPSRPVLSLLVIVGFIGVNLLGVHESGVVEDLLVALKLIIVLLFIILGIRYGYTHGQLEFGVERTLKQPDAPVLAAAVAFVSFEGWQLLFYDQESIENPVATIRKAVYISIPVSALSYILVAFVALSVANQRAVIASPDLALAIAAREFSGRIGYVLIGVAAVASTASAINATLFSTALFAKGMSTDDLLPDRLAPTREAGVPTKTLFVIGGLTILLTVYGSLTAITEFASLSFIVVFGAMNALAYTQRSELISVIPLVGLIGTALFLPIFVWHLYTAEFGVFCLVFGIAITLILLEGLYFERDEVMTGVESIEKRF